MRCCSARWADRNGTSCRSTRSRNAACCGCARIWSCSPICGPALCFDALKDASTLKPEIVSGLDILIVRELTGGVYFGEPKETTTLPDGQKRAVDTQVYTTSEIERIARVAFELARLRGKRVASAEKSNVMVTGVLWREVVHAVHDGEFPDVAAHPYPGRQLRHAAGAQSQDNST